MEEEAFLAEGAKAMAQANTSMEMTNLNMFCEEIGEGKKGVYLYKKP